ncbi:MAG: bifunctional 5,10-methylenetetrahydrofolate dehydrogenase/5,10-methenyltetrahydrofolate cyclohydrolase [Candidatus Pacebacteria bacterium]|nr:bifunctional 5,10-methylenetetrahydrofolate dehydrogenase/5,10-methenyltetrahydrofolate cyclohydrolase [Candidatus Paceibacterota bacterium]
MIIDGRVLAKEVLARARARAEALPRRPRVVAFVAPNETAATRSYLAIKAKSATLAGCDFETRDIQITDRPSQYFDIDADAIIVQLPLPADIATKEILDAIPLEKDADVLSSTARTQSMLLPPVVGAVKEIFDTYHIETKGKHAVVVGNGYLVGAPAATWLRAEGAEVEVVERPTDNLAETLLTADIIVSGTGSPHLIKPEMLKEGVVLIDAGTSESSGKIVGDADPACAAKCTLFTPVPGGVGPLAVAKLFENVVTLAERATLTKLD